MSCLFQVSITATRCFERLPLFCLSSERLALEKYDNLLLGNKRVKALSYVSKTTLRIIQSGLNNTAFVPQAPFSHYVGCHCNVEHLTDKEGSLTEEERRYENELQRMIAVPATCRLKA